MNEGVDDADEGSVAAGVVLCAAPGDHRHDGVMVQVKERYLVVFLSQHEENCI